ncbi:DUF2335 domain-containing protein [Halorhodospira sp. 9622]|uniref:DUF2335 domain-containing protein n=1 Tax=Halorhodospira sp. 9622 TaxID=2899136 RepID=UPI001EE8B1C4|nr:DUF2335 domain-containing protein [Halorhodospira sp. 9622]MCG5538971.1 DUF2335 domain-containing protein [Halorhodospira sp. 9622]
MAPNNQSGKDRSAGMGRNGDPGDGLLRDRAMLRRDFERALERVLGDEAPLVTYVDGWPSATTFKRCERIRPGSAREILEAMKEEQARRHARDHRMLESRREQVERAGSPLIDSLLTTTAFGFLAAGTGAALAGWPWYSAFIAWLAIPPALMLVRRARRLTPIRFPRW